MQSNLAFMTTMTLKVPSSSNFDIKASFKPSQNIQKFLSQHTYRPLSLSLAPNSKPSSGPLKVQCYICVKSGHYANHCFKLLGILTSKIIIPLEFYASLKDSTFIAHPIQHQWLLNSGTIYHLIGNVFKLQHMEPFVGSSLHRATCPYMS